MTPLHRLEPPAVTPRPRHVRLIRTRPYDWSSEKVELWTERDQVAHQRLVIGLWAAAVVLAGLSVWLLWTAGRSQW